MWCIAAYVPLCLCSSPPTPTDPLHRCLVLDRSVHIGFCRSHGNCASRLQCAFLNLSRVHRSHATGRTCPQVQIASLRRSSVPLQSRVTHPKWCCMTSTCGTGRVFASGVLLP
ncbi:hypothetical protein C8Q73DRAFT_718831 [Cubamyces lactineus]|nr:hypothetical protein C8Q73DRAFT_718831 [Cubamyces lactineus]